MVFRGMITIVPFTVAVPPASTSPGASSVAFCMKPTIVKGEALGGCGMVAARAAITQGIGPRIRSRVMSALTRGFMLRSPFIWGCIAAAAREPNSGGRGSTGCLQYVLSLVTTDVAKSVAQASSPFLGRGKVYLDLTSTSAGAKRTIQGVVAPTGAAFVEG